MVCEMHWIHKARQALDRIAFLSIGSMQGSQGSEGLIGKLAQRGERGTAAGTPGADHERRTATADRPVDNARLPPSQVSTGGRRARESRRPMIRCVMVIVNDSEQRLPIAVVGICWQMLQFEPLTSFWRRPWVWVSAHNVTHNASSQRSRNSPNSRRSRPDVAHSKVHKYNILRLASLTECSECHLYYDI
jgi:hypothetical protein